MSSSHSTAVFRTSQIESIWSLASPFRAIAELARRRHLLWQFTLREVQGRYRGSYLGIFWALVTPLLMLLVYTFVFHNIMHANWSGSAESFLSFAVNMYSGIIPFNVFSETVNRAPLLVVQNPNYVKKVVFPLEILPVSLVGSALIHSLLSLMVLVIFALSGAATPHLTLFYLPVVYVPLVLLTLGAAWLLASLGVFLRDIGNVVSVVVSLLFFLTPIAYPITAIADGRMRWAIELNPLTGIVDNFRRVVNGGRAPDWVSLGIATALSALLALFGYAWFMKFKRAFADVI